VDSRTVGEYIMNEKNEYLWIMKQLKGLWATLSLQAKINKEILERLDEIDICLNKLKKKRSVKKK
jgi:hypothetical protein